MKRTPKRPFPLGVTVHDGKSATVRWSDGRVTVGDPANAHMRALIDRCLRDYGPRGVDVTSRAYDEGFSLAHGGRT